MVAADRNRSAAAGVHSLPEIAVAPTAGKLISAGTWYEKTPISEHYFAHFCAFSWSVRLQSAVRFHFHRQRHKQLNFQRQATHGWFCASRRGKRLAHSGN